MKEEMMRRALAEAAESGGDVPVGAVVARDGEVISAAHNEREAGHDPFAHAEMLAMRRACERLGDRRLRGCTLYVTLEPCPMCAGAMVMAEIDRCVFGAYDARQGCCGSVYDLLADPALGSGVAWEQDESREECRRLLQECFAKRRGNA